MYRPILLLLAVVTGALSIGAMPGTADTVVDFESLDLDFGATGADTGPYANVLGRTPDGFGGEDIESTFSADGASFRNVFNDPGGYWSGFAVSQRGLDQWSSGPSGGFLPLEYTDDNDTVSLSGDGAFGSQTWAVAFGAGVDDSFSSVMEAPDGTFFESLHVNNTRTTDHVIRNGNDFTNAFGSRNQDELFTVRFFDLSTGEASGFVEQIMASYDRGTDSLSILDNWTRVDLTQLDRATRIGIDFTSTDIGTFGINTPAYAAIDSITVTAVPEPSALVFLAASMAGLFITVRRRRAAANSANHVGPGTYAS